MAQAMSDFEMLYGIFGPSRLNLGQLGQADGQLREAMRPMSQSEIAQRQLQQLVDMRGMTDEELAARYGNGLMNAYRSSEDDKS